jgi:4-aminobutyrate aminotransferase
MGSAEFVKTDGSNAPDPDLRNKIVMASFDRGLLVLGCGESGIRFSLALTVSAEQIDTAVKLMGEAIAEVFV